MSFDTPNRPQPREEHWPFTPPGSRESVPAIWLISNNPVRAELVSVTVKGIPRSRHWACAHFGREHVDREEVHVACMGVVATVPVVDVLDIDEAHGRRRRPPPHEYDFQKRERF